MTRSGWPHSSPGPYLPQPHVRFRRQRGEVREVGDVRGHHDGYVQRVRVFGAFIVFKGEDCPVLFRNVDVPYHGDDSQHGFSRVFLHVTVRRGKQGGIPSEFVDHESRQQFPFPRGEGHPRAQEGGVHAAPVNVPGEQDFSAGVAGHVHVDHVRGFQVDFPPGLPAPSRQTRSYSSERES